MKAVKHTIFYLFLFLNVSCTNNSEKNAKNVEIKDSVFAPIIEEDIINNSSSMEWIDDSVSHYVQQSQMELIVLDRKNKEHISWMIDEQERNGRKYYAVKIGRDFENRFVSDGWIFIDSASRQIYEYDLAADSLIEFSNQ